MKKVLSLAFLLCVVLLASILPPATAKGSEWQGAFSLPLEGNRFGPLEPLKVALPEDLAAETIGWLGLEVDNVDVTSLVALEGTVAVFRPPQALPAGEHTIRLVQYTSDGGMIERGSWSFTVRSVAVYSFRSEVTFDGSYRAGQSGFEDQELPDKRYGMDGTMTVAGDAGTPGLGVGGSGDFLYNNDPQGDLHKFDLSEFLVQGRARPLHFNLGHHSVGSENMIMEGFHRRGISADLQLLQERVLATGFALRREPVVGFREGLGIGESDNRVNGLVLTLRPFPERLAFSGMFLKGRRGAESGEGVIDAGAASRGEAWSVMAEGLLLGRHVHFRGEYAASVFEEERVGAEEEKDKGFSALVELIFFGGGLTFGGEHRQIGPFFKSLANEGLTADLRSTQGFTKIRYGLLDLGVNFTRDEDNVDDDETLPRYRSDVLSGELALSAAEAGFLGRWNTAISARRAQDGTVSLPEGYGWGELDRRTTELRVSLGSGYSSWDWSAAYGTGRQEDDTGATADTRSRNVELSVNLRPVKRFTLGIFGQWTHLEEDDSDRKQEGRMARANATLVLLPERLTSSLSFHYGEDTVSDESRDQADYGGDARLELVVVKPRPARPGLTLWTSGQYQRTDDRVAEDGDGRRYQIFCGGKIAWSFAYPQPR